MSTQKNRVDLSQPWCQTKTLDGYRTEVARVPGSTGPKGLTADDCLSGDWAGVVCSAGRLRVVLADVEGKGHGVRSFHETLTRHLPAPAALTRWLTELNADWPAGRFASVGVVEVDIRCHQFRVTLAGHPDPVLRLPGAAARAVPECRLGLVGLNLGEPETEPGGRPFPRGACLVLVSDGVLDAGVWARGEAFGMRRLLAAVDGARSPAQVASRVLEAVHQHLGGGKPEDDMTVLTIARTRAAASAGANGEGLAA
jgi:serine phosphatase RsbU (regulator of sigma subunit)